ncbi:hypothetical protein [Streptomyces sp. NPDC003077]|uniref:hypothetical protein n=1 Tax=Streptomyces sp. NPDC003077 TaxID=3154443 RepID=UPI0033BACC04
MTRRSPFRVAVTLTAASAALLTLSGCVTVHGEREMLPAVSKDEAGTVLKGFVSGFNKSNSKLDPTLNPGYEGDSLLAIDQAVTKAARAISPGGNPKFPPLVLTDPNFTIPRQAGWPRVFVADAASNRNNGRWFLAFSRESAQAKWKAVYLSTLSDAEIPQFTTDKDGYAELIRPEAENTGLKVDPGALGKTYATYLKTGRTDAGQVFASGPHTDGWRANRARVAFQPGARLQWEDQASDYPPVALRTTDGGALVFFSTYYHQQKTFTKGSKVRLPKEMKGILDGPEKPTDKMTFTTLTEQAVQVPAKDSADRITFLHRLEAKTSAKTL